MNYPRKVYAIFPYDENHHIAGVYVGSTWNVEERIRCHKGDHKSLHMAELHDLMRRHGFIYKVMDEIKEWKDCHIEYDWIDYFMKKTDLKVFNYRKGLCGADWHRIGGLS